MGRLSFQLTHIRVGHGWSVRCPCDRSDCENSKGKIAWRGFAGALGGVYAALVKGRGEHKGLDSAAERLAWKVRLHLYTGVA